MEDKKNKRKREGEEIPLFNGLCGFWICVEHSWCSANNRESSSLSPAAGKPVLITKPSYPANTGIDTGRPLTRGLTTVGIDGLVAAESTFLCDSLVLIELGCTKGTRPNTVLASDTLVGIELDNAVDLVFGDRTNRTGRQTWRLAAVHARHRYKVPFRVWIAALLNIDYTVVIHANGGVVLRLAVCCASPAPCAVFEVDPKG